MCAARGPAGRAANGSSMGTRGTPGTARRFAPVPALLVVVGAIGIDVRIDRGSADRSGNSEYSPDYALVCVF